MLHNGLVYRYRASKADPGTKDQTFNQANANTHLNAAMGCARWAAERSPLDLESWAALLDVLEAISDGLSTSSSLPPSSSSKAVFGSRVKVLMARIRSREGHDEDSMADVGSEASTLDVLRGIQAKGNAEGKSLTCALSGVGTADPATISGPPPPKFLCILQYLLGV